MQRDKGVVIPVEYKANVDNPVVYVVLRQYFIQKRIVSWA